MRTTTPLSSLNQQATDIIRDWILKLEIRPGEPLVILNISRKLGVSTTPVRDALRKLSEEGLVRINGKKCSVARLDKKEEENIFLIRQALEMLAMQQAAAVITSEHIERLWKTFREYEEHVGKEAPIEYFISHDLQFHAIISEASQNERLSRMLERLHAQIWWITRYSFLKNPVKYVGYNTIDEHREILETLEKREIEAASAAMRKHLEGARKRLL